MGKNLKDAEDDIRKYAYNQLTKYQKILIKSCEFKITTGNALRS